MISDIHRFGMPVRENCYVDKSAIKKLIPATLEGCVVRVSDIIAYLGKDRQDAEKLGLFDKKPEYTGGKIGISNAEIINNMIVNLVENSYGKEYLKMDKEYFEAFSAGKKENYELIYKIDKIEKVYQEDIFPMMEQMYERLLADAKVHDKKSVLYEHHVKYIQNIMRYSPNKWNYEECESNAMVVDYIASMTDDYFVDLYKHLFPGSKYDVKYIGYFD